MNKPPGHYKDEKGYEYYWDGRTRSYIPENSYQRFRRDLDRGANVVLWIYVGVLALPVIGFVVLLIGWGIWENLGILIFIIGILIAISLIWSLIEYSKMR